jgi:adenylate cyclase class 1
MILPPHGIVDYSPDLELKKHLKNAYPTISFENSKEEPFVQMIAIIGSAGTIAYNRKSDFDFWVCVDKRSISEKKFAYFREKIEKIQSWAELNSGAEIHLFINDIQDLQKNIFDEDEEEAFGSTLGALLKDEFYRSSIVMAGKTPFWWAVPTGTDDQLYSKTFNDLDDELKKTTFIDIGNLHHIKKEDFIGAALFQIVKSLGNPFKSILKLGVLEKYLFESNSPNLISSYLKSQVHQERLTNTIIDSYLLMFAHVYKYYKENGMEQAQLLILKINLYLKISPNLSKYTSFDNRKLPSKVMEMLRYSKHWGWNKKYISELDSFDDWEFMKVTKFWDQVRKFMLISYQKISKEFANFDLKSKISESDYKLLSIKIRSYFSVNPEKIEKYISFKETSGETYLHIYEQSTSNNEQIWYIQKKSSASSKENQNVTIKQSNNIFALIAWASINGVYEKSLTRISMDYQEGNIDTQTIELLNIMYDTFNSKDLKPKNSYYLHEAFNLRSLIVYNYGNRLNPESERINFLYLTSWNEAYHNSYNGNTSLIKILPIVIQTALHKNESFDTVCKFYTADKHKSLIRDFQKVFKKAFEHFSNSQAENIRFYNKNVRGIHCNNK